jgi:hypothetical protein
MSDLNEAYRQLAEVSKRIADESLGWHYDEVRQLALGRDGVVSSARPAEVRNEPVMGFSPKRVRSTVRLQVDLDQDPEHVLVATDGLSLYEGEQLFGDERAWRVTRAFAKDNMLDLWLECD